MSYKQIIVLIRHFDSYSISFSDITYMDNFAYLNQPDEHAGFTNNFLASRHNNKLFQYRYSDFPMFDEDSSTNTANRDILKGIITRSDLSDRFFSKTNINHIKFTLSKILKERKGYTISPQYQSDTELLVIMRYIFLEYSNNLEILATSATETKKLLKSHYKIDTPSNNHTELYRMLLEQQQAELNLKVLIEVYPIILSNILGELSYQRDHGSQPLPMERGQYISSAGTRSNRSVTDLFI